MRSNSQRIIQGTILIFVFMVLSSLVGYLLKFILARSLTLEDIGLFYSVLGFVSFFIFLRDLGLSDSLSYFIPRFLVEKSKKKIKAALIFVGIIQITLGLLFFAGFIFLSGFLAGNYFKDERAVSLIIALGLFFVLDGLMELLFRAFHGFQHIFLNQAIEFSFNLLIVAIAGLLLFYGFPVEFLGISYAAGSLIVLAVFSIVFFKRVFPDFFRIKYTYSWKFSKELLSYSFPAMFGGAAQIIFNHQTIILLTLLVGVEAVGLYVMAYAIAKLSMHIFKSISHVFAPMISQFWKKKDMKSLNYYQGELVIFSFLFALPFSLTLIAFSEEVLRILFAEQFVAAAGILKLLALYFLIFTFYSVYHQLMLFTGHPKVSSRVIYTNVAVNLVANLLLIPLYGVIGAGMADLFSGSVSLVYMILISKKYIRLALPYPTLYKIAFASLAYIFSVLIFKRLFVLPVFLEMFLILFLSGWLYALLLLLLRIITLDKINAILKNATNNRVSIPFFIK